MFEAILGSVLLAAGLAAPSPVGATLSVAAPVADTFHLVAAPEGNRARYRVREQLARLDFPNDAVGETSSVSGTIMVTPTGEIVRGASLFVIRLADMASDQDRRDNFLRRNTLETDTYPEATFVPTAFQGLTFPLPESGPVRFQLVGDFTVRDVTRSITWEVEAETAGGAVLGQARTTFTFGEMGLTIPRVGSVLSIRDEIRLEYDFRLQPAGN